MGCAHVHSEYALVANVIVAAEGATFHDIPHFAGGIVPAMEFLLPGVIALVQDEQRHSC